MQQTVVHTCSLVCIAAPQDASLLASWENHLRPLQQARRLSFWSERALLPGSDRLQQFLARLDQAEVIIVLISAHFFANEECCQFMDHALQRHQTGLATVVPLLGRSVSWHTSPLGVLTCVPANGIPVTMWGDEDEGWHTCVLDLQRLLGHSAARMPHPPRSTSEHSDWGKFLRLLRRDYHKDLDASLERLVWQELGLHEHPGAVLTRISQRRPDQSERALPPGTSILQVFDEAAEALLILGEPGAGKSTLLTTLGLHLVTRAETDPGHPLPVIIPLSSWAEGKPALGEWLIEQIAVRYGVPRYLGRRWVRQHRVLPLLDGLDEMEETARVQCITALNTYRKATFSSLVVCSRTTEYQAASVRHRLVLQQAVIVQPLTEPHIMRTIRQGGTALAALEKALAASEELRNLARTPLMLSILMLTYQGITRPELSEPRRALEQQIWQQYLERMMTDKGAERKRDEETMVKRYDLARTHSWLAWLAQQMRAHHQTVFSGEDLQQSWLPPPLLARASWLVETLPIMLLGAAASIFLSFLLVSGVTFRGEFVRIGLVGGFLGWCLCSEKSGPRSMRSRGQPTFQIQARRLLSAGCLAFLYPATIGLDLEGSFYTVSDWTRDWIIFGCALLVSGWLLQAAFARRLSISATTRSQPSARWNRFSHWWHSAAVRHTRWTIVILGLSSGLSEGLSYTLHYGLREGLSYGLSVGLNYAPNYALNNGFTYGLAILLLCTILDENSTTPRLAEQISWTWHALFRRQHLQTSLLVTVILAGFFEPFHFLSYGLGVSDRLRDGLSIGLSYGLGYWLLLGLYQGMAQKHIEDRDRRQFNQGLHRSLRNSLLLSVLGEGLLMGALLLGNWLGVSLGFWLDDWGRYWLNSWPLLFLCGWFVLWALIGGITILRHYTLRVLLARSHTFPLHARRFLDDAVARVLLKRQGGGYAFVHRRLLDYCADTRDTTSETEKTV